MARERSKICLHLPFLAGLVLCWAAGCRIGLGHEYTLQLFPQLVLPEIQAILHLISQMVLSHIYLCKCFLYYNWHQPRDTGVLRGLCCQIWQWQSPVRERGSGVSSQAGIQCCRHWLILYKVLAIVRPCFGVHSHHMAGRHPSRTIL